MIFRMEGGEVPVVEKEMWYYAGFPRGVEPPEPVKKLMSECVDEMRPVIRPQLVYEVFPREELDFIINPSKDLQVNLKGCSQVLIFASTIGPLVDALIRRTQGIDAAKAGIMQAVGAMFIESFVDTFNEKINTENNGNTKPRFSPGYGDVPLTVQKDFFRLLPCSKIGLTLMDNLIMAPEKSVTAFIGIKNHE